MSDVIVPRPLLITATRMPSPPTDRGTHLFASNGDAVVDCQVVDEHGKKCGWHASGPRSDLVIALRNHQRMYHSQASDPMVTLINAPSQ